MEPFETPRYRWAVPRSHAKVGSMKPIYLDHNSTTPLDPLVQETLAAAYAEGYLNPASQHQPGQRARRVLEENRRRIAELLGARTGGMQADRLVFTSGGTESNNWVLRGLAGRDRTRQLLVSAIEHPSIQGPAEYLRQLGFPVQTIPVDTNGMIRLDSVEQLLDKPTSLVSVMWANNETGVIQPLDELITLCHARGVPVHTDAVQAVGKIPVNFSAVGVDALTFTPHKFHGPRGIGGLLLRAELTVEPLLYGGFQQAGLRPGTEDVALTAGCRKALEIALTNLPEQAISITQKRDQFLDRLRSELGGLVTVNGEMAPRLPNTLNVAFPGVDRQALLLAADFAGLAISTGSACASGSSEPSPILLAMNLPPEVVESSIRISFGRDTSDGDLEEAASRLGRLVKDLKK